MRSVEWDYSRLSYLREMCDIYFDPRDCDPGAGSTRFYSDGIEFANDLAVSALKFYNEKERKNFYLEKVGKINKFVTVRYLTFWARNAESDESCLFRGVVDLLKDKVLLCEIKDGNEITIPDNHFENCRLQRSCTRTYDCLANDSAGGSIGASFGSDVGLDGVDLINVGEILELNSLPSSKSVKSLKRGKSQALGFRPIDDSRFSYLREMCDRYFDPRDCDPGAGSTRFYSDGIEYANDLAESALNFYNEKERKNFLLEKVGKINKFVTVRYLTFWARNAGSDESCLFQGVVDLLKDKVLLCEIKSGNEITIPDNHSENCRLQCSRIPYYLANVTVSGSVYASSGAAGGLGGVGLCSVDGFDVASGSLG